MSWEIFENPESDDAWEQKLGWFKSSQNYRNLDRIDGHPMEFECEYFHRKQTIRCSSVKKSNVFCSD